MIRLSLVIIFFISIFTGNSLAQTPEPFKELRFLNYNPNWISLSQDETFQTVQQWDQYNRVLPSFRFYQPEAIVHGNYLYSALRTGTWDLEGFLLEKRNLQTGEIIWKQPYDMRNLIRQEAPFTLRIKESGDLQLINYRRINPPDNPAFPGGFAGGGDNSHLSIMEFDTATGELVRHLHPASNDTAAAVIRQFYKFVTQLWHVETDTFQWLNYSYDYKDTFPESIGAYHASYLHNHVLLKEDSALHQYDTSAIELSDIGSGRDRRCFQYTPDSIYCISYIYSKTDRSKWFGKIDLYNRHLELLSTHDVSDVIPFSKVNQIIHVSSDKILMFSTDFTENDDDRIISLDKNGNLIEILYLKDIIQRFNGYNRTTVIESPIDDGLIVFSLDKVNQLLYLMKSDGQGNLSVIRTIETFLPSYVAYPIQLVYDSINNNLIAHLMHARYEFNNNSTIYHGNWSNWVSLPLDEFVAVEDQDQVLTRFAITYPNPTSGELTIAFSFEEGDRISLHTIEGKLVENYKTVVSNEKQQIQLPNGLASGTYILHCHDKRNRFKFSTTIILK